MTPTIAYLLIIAGFAILIAVLVRASLKLGQEQVKVNELRYKLNVCKDALRFAKPVVGAACAASTNDNREARQKVYDRIERALQ